MITIPLSLLLDRGVALDTDEAVAIVQALVSSRGVPTAETVELDSAGHARCRNDQGEPTVAALAALLQRLLPVTGVPGPLRYTVARGIGAVEAPPFRSPDDFSQALSRFERRDRESVIQGLLSRARPAPPSARPAPPSARPAPPSARPAPPSAWPPHLTAGPARSTARAEQPNARPAQSPARDTPLPVRRAARRPVVYTVAALLMSALAGFDIQLLRLHPAAFAPESAPAPTPSSPSPASVSGADVPVAAPSPLPVPPPPVPTPTSSSAPRSDVTQDVRHSRAAGTVQPVRALPAGALPAGQTAAFSPAFSSAGTAMFFQTGGTHDPSSAIAVARWNAGPAADLRIMKIVDDGARNYHAQPSPNGRMIAFDSDRDGVRGVYLADRDGTHVRRVSGEGYAALPSWSPDGSRLAFVRAEPAAPSVWNIWIQPIAGGPAQHVTHYRYGQTWTASWFPDGHRVAYSHEDELTILDLETSRAQHFRTPVRGRLVRTPAVSPDGSRVVFQVLREGVWMLDVHDGSMECVLADPTAEEFAWAPDGRRFAFHSRRDGEWGIYVLTASATLP